MNETSKTLKIYDFISKGCIYLLVFITPLMFFSKTSDALDFNKQAVIIFLSIISLFFWMTKSLVSGNIKANINILLVPIALFLVVYSLSTFFSLYRYGSIWGMSSSISSGLISLVCYIIVYFLISSIFEKKEIIRLCIIFAFSTSIAFLFSILQLLGKFILPFGFSQSPSFNTIGTPNTAGILAAAVLPLIISLFLSQKRIIKAIFGASALIAFILLLLVNFKYAWIVLAVGSAILMAFQVQKKESFEGRRIILPMFLLAISLIFVFFNFSVISGVSRPIEVYLSQKVGFDVAKNTLTGSAAFGSGPSTFSYDFSKFRNISLNSNMLWNIRFENAGSKILTLATEIGIIGLVVFAFILLIFFLKGIIYFAKGGKQDDDNVFYTVSCGIFSSFSALIFSQFLYASSIILDLAFFMLLGILSALLYQERKYIQLRQSSFLNLVIIFSFTIAFIAGFGIAITEGQRYLAELNYYNGLVAQSSGDIDGSVLKMEKAIALNPKSEVYWREISQAYMGRLNLEVSKKDANKEEQAKIAQSLIRNAITSCSAATELNPKNVANWSVKGFVYQNLLSFFSGADEYAIKAYDEAINLEPTNPYYLNQQGITDMTKYYLISAEDKEGRAKKLAEAKQKFETAINLKQDYAPALFQLALAYSAEGKEDEAIAKLESAKEAAPFDVGLAFQLGLMYYKNNNFDKAKSELERAVTIDPRYANALYFLALTYDRLNQRDKALEFATQVADLNPDNPEAQKVLDNLRNGRSALDGVVSANPPAAPVEEKPEEIKNNEKPAVSPAPNSQQ